MLVAALLLAFAKKRREHLRNGEDIDNLQEIDFNPFLPPFLLQTEEDYKRNITEFPYPVESPRSPVKNFTYPLNSPLEPGQGPDIAPSSQGPASIQTHFPRLASLLQSLAELAQDLPISQLNIIAPCHRG